MTIASWAGGLATQPVTETTHTEPSKKKHHLQLLDNKQEFVKQKMSCHPKKKNQPSTIMKYVIKILDNKKINEINPHHVTTITTITTTNHQRSWINDFNESWKVSKEPWGKPSMHAINHNPSGLKMSPKELCSLKCLCGTTSLAEVPRCWAGFSPHQTKKHRNGTSQKFNIDTKNGHIWKGIYINVSK